MDSRKLRSRSTYALVGLASGAAIAVLMYAIGNRVPPFLTSLPIIGMVLALWWGERRGRIPTVDEENRPTTLFGNEPTSKQK